MNPMILRRLRRIALLSNDPADRLEEDRCPLCGCTPCNCEDFNDDANTELIREDKTEQR